MDKDLRKLNRRELLELLLTISEDNDVLLAENRDLKKAASAPRLPRTAKVGSIAEAALQANGFFKAAQTAADDYLREIKHLRDELARRNEEVYAGIQDARNDEKTAQAMARARTEAQEILRQAKRQADEIVAAAQVKAQATLEAANIEVEKVVVKQERPSEVAARQRAERAAEREAEKEARSRGFRGEHGRKSEFFGQAHESSVESSRARVAPSRDSLRNAQMHTQGDFGRRRSTRQGFA